MDIRNESIEPSARIEAAGRDVRSGPASVLAPVLPDDAGPDGSAGSSAAVEYVGGQTFGAFLSMLERRHPRLHALLDARCRDESHTLPEVLALNSLSWEFEGQQDGGRGTEYNRAQRNVDGWFREAVDRYSITGHPHPHFSRGEMTDLLEGAGFARVRVFEMEDPFTLAGASAAEARQNMLAHLHGMYGLVKLSLADPQDRAVLESLARRTLGEISVGPADGRFEATLKRPALVAVGTR